MAARSPHTHHVAIDFGTAGSGMAFCNVGNPHDIHVYSNWAGMRNGVDCKCPTVLLLDPDQNVEAFGHDAIIRYTRRHGVKYPERMNEYYYFQYFKMALYHEENITTALTIKAENGRSLPAVTVFAKALQFMMDTMNNFFDKTLTEGNREILWIITVPAIWSPAAKQIMREAAEKAGVKGDSLMFALEPEAAAVFCQTACSKNSITDSLRQNSDTSVHHYLVIDCGGGTVDMAAHKWTNNGGNTCEIEELVPADGGPFGGFKVNEEFEKMLQAICRLSDEDLQALKQQETQQWLKMMNGDFEENKNRIDPQKTEAEIFIEIPRKVLKAIKDKTGKDMKELVADFKDYTVIWDEDALGFPYATARALFIPVISGIKAVARQLLRKPECREITTIYLVGGFAESNLLYKEMEREFQKYSVKQGTEPYLSVLKGAILFSLNTGLIKVRKIRQTVGVETCQEFKEGYHNPDFQQWVDGALYCQNLFSTFVKLGDSVENGKTVEHMFHPLTKVQNACTVNIFASYSVGTRYVTDKSAFKLGELNIPDLPTHQSGRARAIKVIMDFSSTEIKVTAFNVSEQKVVQTTISTNFVLSEGSPRLLGHEPHQPRTAIPQVF